MTFFELLKATEAQLLSVTDEALLDSKILIKEAFHFSDSTFVLNLSEPVLNPIHLQRFHDLVQARLTGKPLAYVLGKAWFYGRDYVVAPGVLIPRPETELLVEKCLDVLSPDTVVLECGVGSGIIGITLKLARPACSILGWDISPVALAIAKKNAETCHADISFYVGDFFAAADVWRPILDSARRVLLVSNPPYISTLDYAELAPGVRDFEPPEALLGGEDGLSYYHRFFEMFLGYDNVTMAFEIGLGQAEALTASFSTFSSKKNVCIYPDLAGIPRVFMVI